MTIQPTKEQLDYMRENLPLPSEIKTDSIEFPYRSVYAIVVSEAWIAPAFGSVTFKKVYVDGIAIGWEL
jgi:hypothetical protein